jgi:hypothetical protein
VPPELLQQLHTQHLLTGLAAAAAAKAAGGPT